MPKIYIVKAGQIMELSDKVYGPFDKSKVIIEPVVHKNNYSSSPIKYLYNDEKLDLLFMLPTSSCYGINPIYPFGTREGVLQGYQFCYTIKDEYFRRCLCELNKVVFDYINYTSDRLPDSTINAFTSALTDNKRAVDYVVKPCYGKDDKMYIKLNTFGNGQNVRVNTVLYSDLHRISVNAFLDRPCEITPLISCKHVYWGSHGSNSHGASVKFKLEQAVLKEKQKALSEDTILDILE